MSNQDVACPDAIRFNGLSVDFDGRFQLSDISWTIRPGEHWLIAGGNGSGKSALAAVLAGEGECLSGTQSGLPDRVALVSYERQAELIEAERRKDDADILDVISEGTPVAEIIDAVCRGRRAGTDIGRHLGFAAVDGPSVSQALNRRDSQGHAHPSVDQSSGAAGSGRTL